MASVNARLSVIVIGSLAPVSVLGSILIWNSYQQWTRPSEVGLQDLVRRMKFRLNHDVDRIGSVLETTAVLDPYSELFARDVMLVQNLSGSRFCFIGSVKPSGEIGRSGELTSSGGNCEHVVVSHVQRTGNPPFSVVTDRGVPYLLIMVGAFSPSATYSDSSREVPQGQVVAAMPLEQSILPLISDTHGSVHPEEGLEGSQVWLLNKDAGAVAICPECGWTLPPDILSDSRVKAVFSASGDQRRTLADAWVSKGYLWQTAYLGGAVPVLAGKPLSPAERSAGSLFVVWLAVLAGMLTAALIGVAIGARELVLRPVQKLKAAAVSWEKTGQFQVSRRGMPLEFRQFVWAFHLVTARLSRRETELELSLEGQRELLKEAHHRVKNNLQIIASLLNLQASRIADREAKAQVLRARERVRSLGTLHRYLYDSGDTKSFHVRPFLRELSAQIVLSGSSAREGAAEVRLHFDADDITLTPDQAVPLTLLLTEIMTNAVQYAFPDGRQGKVSLLVRKEGNMATVRAGDNGIGMTKESSGLGLRLINGFSRQLGARMSVKSRPDEGTWFTFRGIVLADPPEPFS
ncbi:sensor histidine kinase [Acetobacter sp. AN02]|uniref:sensor histidine kinase n=1 Tax=Acetobacter sp. AN02 TaxID=2894186 RepID=UPI0024344AD4|nr:sensor histidine kinase [Acetobacter sp. AN02]MDG6093979.1 sensor histidine kinase [Acetobacter sp. AN02]